MGEKPIKQAILLQGEERAADKRIGMTSPLEGREGGLYSLIDYQTIMEDILLQETHM